MLYNNWNFQRGLKFREYLNYRLKIETFEPNNANALINQVKTIESSQVFSDSVYMVFSRRNHQALYISKNVESIMGFTPDEVTNWKSKIFFKVARWQHINFMLTLNKWTASFFNYGKEKFGGFEQVGHLTCGLKLGTKSGETLRVFTQQFEPITNQKRQDVILLKFDDISHLVKEDFYWAKFIGTSQNHQVGRFYQSKTKGKFLNEIITPREKEILTKSAEGLNTK